MALSNIIIFSFVALGLIWIPKGKSRSQILLSLSLLSVFWLQPLPPIRNFDFWFPIASIILTIIAWRASQARISVSSHGFLVDTIIIIGTIVIVGLTRYLGSLCCITATRPPQLTLVIIMAVIPTGLLIGFPILIKNRKIIVLAASILLIFIFIVLKYPHLTTQASKLLRSFNNQDTELALSTDLPWLGFSYLAFRLIHILRDRLTRRLPDVSLGEFLTYALFFPTLTAGPIDRIERYVTDLRSSGRIRIENLFVGVRKIILGVFKKFVLADNLALFALNAQHASDTNSVLWMWIILYAYTLRIYFDFSGYTDVALGLGRILGFDLPDNFSAPYFKSNITSFWNSWHITLAQWFRSYFFNPFTRALRTSSSKLPIWLIILLGQVGTMGLIGLWHGITVNFLIWGLWHAIGLFIHNRWLNWIRSRTINPVDLLKSNVITNFLGWAITFNYITLGWVWFALPSFQQSKSVLLTLIGLAP